MLEIKKWISAERLMKRWDIKPNQLLALISNEKLACYQIEAAYLDYVDTDEIYADHCYREVQKPSGELSYGFSLTRFQLKNIAFKRNEIESFEKRHPELVGHALSDPAPNRNSKSFGFKHSDDYRSVGLDGEVFELTPNQAAVICILHEAYQYKLPGVSQANILERIDSSGNRLRDVFKGDIDAYNKLIAKSKKRDLFKLNIP